MEGAIIDRDAILFSRELYTALGLAELSISIYKSKSGGGRLGSI
jgi:hypothetical protein